MKLPQAVPATPQERVTMLEAKDLADAQRWDISSPRARDRTFQTQDSIAQLQHDAEELEFFHEDPLPPGYEVIFMVDDTATFYGLRLPPGASEDYYLVAEDMRTVLADAWHRYYQRMPDGLPSDIAQRLVDDSPMARPFLWRLLWDIALHHAACQQAMVAGAVAGDPSHSAKERQALARIANERQVASGALEAMRIRRLGHRLGVWDDYDIEQAMLDFVEDQNMVMPWLALFGRYVVLEDPQAARWWSAVSSKAMEVPRSSRDAEKRMLAASERAWAATYLMAVACIAEFRAEAGSSADVDAANHDANHAAKRIEMLGVLPREGMQAHEVMLWARRLLRKQAPRLLSILERQFKFLGARVLVSDPE